MVDIKEIGLITGSQFLNEGVEEVGKTLETTTPTIFGVETSTILDLGIGVLGLALPSFVRLSEDAKTASLIVGGGRIARGIIDLAMKYTAPSGAVSVPLRVSAPTSTSVSTVAGPAGL